MAFTTKAPTITSTSGSSSRGTPILSRAASVAASNPEDGASPASSLAATLSTGSTAPRPIPSIIAASSRHKRTTRFCQGYARAK